jgi:CRISPR/Cas system-associated exonuclease Cas4 (RecB family)
MMLIKTISYSSDKKLARCEQQFSYRYEEHLKPKQKKEGLFRGAIYHDLLAAYRKKFSWKKKWMEIKEKQWDPLFDEEKFDLGLDFMDLIATNVEHYIDVWGENDSKWKIIKVEEKFFLKTALGPPIVWICDAIVQDENGVNILVETKAKKKIPEADERVLQPQVHGYAFLCKQKGIRIDKIIWDYIRTSTVPQPGLLKRGGLSKKKINTDRRHYMMSIQNAGYNPDKYQEILEALPETLVVERVTNSVNLRIGELFVRQWLKRAERAQKISEPLRTWGYGCRFDCDYYKLCQADMRGDVDRNLIIKRDFETKEETEVKSRG